MSSTGRSKGRPPKGTGEVGRDYIVHRARDFIRTLGAGGLSRKTLAQFSGVTPALISYYFPSRDALIHDVAAPVISSYRRDLDALVTSKGEIVEALAEVMRLLLRLYGRDGRLLSAYEDVIGGDAHRLEENHAGVIHGALRSFLGGMIGDGDRGERDVLVVLCAIRGMCESVARTDAELANPAADDETVEGLLHLVTRGLSYWRPDAFSSAASHLTARCDRKEPV